MRMWPLYLSVALGASTIGAQRPAEVVLSQPPFRVHSAFWPNLHNVLYAAAWAARPVSGEKAAGDLPEPLTGSLTDDERRHWTAAVAYYDQEIADLHMLFEMSAIRKATIAAFDDLPAAGLASGQRDVLVAAAPVYRAHWWPAHDRANRAWVAEVMAKVESLRPEVPEKLARLCGTPWLTSELRVDVVRVGAREGAFTSNDPPPGHITISSGNPHVQGWAAVEVLFHEAAHLLVAPMLQAFSAELKAQGKFSTAGRLGARAIDVWHPALFYMTGEVVRQALASRGIAYEPYMYATDLVNRTWPHFRKPLETHWGAYVRGEVSRDEAIKRLVAEL